jgi:hypothetical protein
MKTATNCYAVLSISLQLEQLIKEKNSLKNAKIHLKVLELLVLNEEAADLALLNGRL